MRRAVPRPDALLGRLGPGSDARAAARPPARDRPDALRRILLERVLDLVDREPALRRRGRLAVQIRHRSRLADAQRAGSEPRLRGAGRVRTCPRRPQAALVDFPRGRNPRSRPYLHAWPTRCTSRSYRLTCRPTCWRAPASPWTTSAKPAAPSPGRTN